MPLPWARDMTTADIEFELAKRTHDIEEWEAAAAEEKAHGGSPGEGMYERFDELTHELQRRNEVLAAHVNARFHTILARLGKKD